MSKSCSSCVHVKLKESTGKPCQFSRLCVCVNGSEHTSASELDGALAWAKANTKSN
jgi:hypothetical protein